MEEAWLWRERQRWDNTTGWSMAEGRSAWTSPLNKKTNNIRIMLRFRGDSNFILQQYRNYHASDPLFFLGAINAFFRLFLLGKSIGIQDNSWASQYNLIFIQALQQVEWALNSECILTRWRTEKESIGEVLPNCIKRKKKKKKQLLIFSVK